MAPSPIKTLTVDNFGSRLTRFLDGDINSGYANYSTTWGINNFQQPKQLRFMEAATSIGGAVVTDLIVAGKVRLENSATYVYAIGHTGRLYKIQVNNPNTTNPDYNNPVLVTTLTNSQTFLYGGSIEFFGATQRIWIGCDQGVTRINFDGTGETVIGTTDSTHWISNVPRQSVQFVGSIFYTNGTNIAQIDNTESVVSYTKLTPSFPNSMQARDLDITSNGTYLVITCSEVQLVSILNAGPDSNTTSNGGSELAYWNGSDPGVTQFNSIPAFAQTAYHTFGNNEYAFGYDTAGATMSNPLTKLLTLIFNQSPLPNAVNSDGNLVGWMTPEFSNGFLCASLYLNGNLDQENDPGLFRQLRMSSSLGGGDVLKVPWSSLVTNFTFGGNTSGYPGDVIGIGKLYFSTLEYNGSTTACKLYSFNNVPTGQGVALPGVYETQRQLVSKKIKIPQVRVYLEPAITNNSFQVDILGIAGTVIPGTTQIFNTGGTMNAGDTFVQYTPSHAPTTAIGLRITNIGSVSPCIHKVEIDIAPAGI